MAKGFVAGALSGAVVGCLAAAGLSLSLGPRPGNDVAGASQPGLAQPGLAQPKGTSPHEPVDAPGISSAPLVAPPPDIAAARLNLPKETAASGTPPVRFENTLATVDVVETPEPSAVRPGAERAVAPAAAGARLAPADPVTDVGTGSTTGIASPADRAPARLPRISLDTAVLDAPEAEGAPNRVVVSSDAPVLAARQVEGPQPPRAEPKPDVTTQPLQPPAPPATESASGLAAAREPARDAPQVAPAGSTAAQAGSTISAPRPEPVVDTTPETDHATDEADESANISATGRDGNLARYAVSTDVAPQHARLAVVLMDDGGTPAGFHSLADIALPLTIALDPRSTDVAERMRRYRDQGFEVAVLHVAALELANILAAVPESVALLEPTRWPSADRAAVLETLRRSGHGLVTRDAPAAPSGVATTEIRAELDGRAQDSATIAAFLEKTAANAAVTGDVVLVGRVRAATLEGITRWASGDTAAQTVLVPVSAVLMAQRSEFR